MSGTFCTTVLGRGPPCAAASAGGRRPLAGTALVHVGIGPVADEHVRCGGHARGDVGVQVERGGDGHLRTDDVAHGGQDGAFGVVLALGDHCAVERQQDHVERLRALCPCEAVE